MAWDAEVAEGISVWKSLRYDGGYGGGSACGVEENEDGEMQRRWREVPAVVGNPL